MFLVSKRPCGALGESVCTSCRFATPLPNSRKMRGRVEDSFRCDVFDAHRSSIVDSSIRSQRTFILYTHSITGGSLSMLVKSHFNTLSVLAVFLLPFFFLQIPKSNLIIKTLMAWNVFGSYRKTRRVVMLLSSVSYFLFVIYVMYLWQLGRR